MIKMTFTDNKGNSWIRVSKSKARYYFNAGYVVRFCAVNMNPFGFWNCAVPMQIDYWDNREIGFDKLVDNYEMYNCCYPECGRYASFYIPGWYVNDKPIYHYSINLKGVC